MFPVRPVFLRGWRLIAAAAGCMAAGAGLQRMVVSGETAGPSGIQPSQAQMEKALASPTVPMAESLTTLSVPDKLTALAAALPHMKTADLLPLVEALARRQRAAQSGEPADPFAEPPPDTITPLLRALLLRWAELDPAEMLAFVESGEFQYDYDTRRLAVLALAEVRGVAALEPLRLKWPWLVRIAAREMLVRQPAMLDSLAPLLKGASLQEGDVSGLPDITRDVLLAALGTAQFLHLAAAADDRRSFISVLWHLPFAEALQTTKALPAGSFRDQALLSLLERLETPGADGEDYGGLSFRTEFESLPPGKVRDALTSRYVRIIAREDPDAAVTAARALTDRQLRSQALEEIYEVLPADADPAFTTHLLAEAWLAHPDSHHVGLPSYLRMGEFGSSFPITPSIPFPDEDGTFPPPSSSLIFPVTESNVRASFRAWLFADSHAAEAWLQTVQQRDLRAELTQVLLAKPGYDISLLQDSAQRLAYAADVLFERPPHIAGSFGPPLEPLDRPPSDIVPPELVSTARLHRMATRGFTEEEWAAASPDERYLLSGQAVRNHISSSNPQEALDFFHALPPEERSLEAWHAAGRAYINKDIAEASQWMESLPAGAERDAAATALVERLIRPGEERDAEAAFIWAASMSGDAERARHTPRRGAPESEKAPAFPGSPPNWPPCRRSDWRRGARRSQSGRAAPPGNWPCCCWPSGSPRRRSRCPIRSRRRRKKRSRRRTHGSGWRNP